MNSFIYFFCLPGKFFNSPSILNDNLAGYQIPSCRFLSYSTLNISCQSLWPLKLLLRNQLIALRSFLLYVTYCFPVVVFKIVSLSLTFAISITTNLGVGLFGLIVFGTLCASWIWMSVFIPRLGKFSTIFFQTYFMPFLSL